MDDFFNDSKDLSIALWAANYGTDYASEEAWINCAVRQIHHAVIKGANLLLMPEWLSEMWGKFGPAQGTQTPERIRWEAETAEKLLPVLGRIAGDQGIALLAGTTPAFSETQDTWTNRARLFLPDGKTVFQDKLFFTPSEKTIPGGREMDTLHIVDWNGISIGIAICLDSESPAISTHFRQENIDLLLVPSLTDSVAGYNRVVTCAKARAIELMCPVATVGSIGENSALKNFSAASVFVPCDTEFADGEGIWDSTGLIDNKKTEKHGVLFVTKDVPIERCRQLRNGGAEVWSAEHMSRTIQISKFRAELPRGNGLDSGQVSARKILP